MLEEIQIVRSGRKTLGLEIQEDGTVILRAPHKASQRVLRSFLAERSDWITRNVKKQKASFKKRPRRRFTEGETFMYLGQTFPLLFKEGPGVVTRRPFVVTDAFYLCKTAQPRACQVIERWYKARAKMVFYDRVSDHAQRMGMTFGDVRLSSAKTRWGSCGAKNSLNFNWRLVMAPIPVIDSVVIHELAHCKYKNHGKHFWALVEKHCPDYKTHDAWLKKNVHLLHWET